MFLPEIEAPENISIFIVEDDAELRMTLENALLSEGYKVFSASSGREFLARLDEVNPDVALIDYLLPELDGLSLCKLIKNDPKTFDIGVIIITGCEDPQVKIKGLLAGADEFLTKPVEFSELFVRIKALGKIKKYRDFFKDYQKTLEREVEKKTKELQKAYLRLNQAYKEIQSLSLEVIYRLAKAAEYKDEHTGAHIHRISFYCKRIAEAVGLSKEQVETLQYASPLHDIGKLGIPDSILLKPGPLTPQEREVIKLHTVIGAKILEKSNLRYIKSAEKIALYHHEKWDGTGYPFRLSGKNIPFFARIVAIADVFDALTSDRPYRKALPFDMAVQIIKSEKGFHFDPEVVEAFLKVKSDLIEIKMLLKDEEIPHLFKLYQELKK